MANPTLPCWICGAPSDRWNCPEARVCGDCYSSSPSSLDRVEFQVSGTDARKSSGADVVVDAPSDHSPSIKLIFGPEGLGTLVRKVFKPELQLGRKEFDDQVYLEHADEFDATVLRSYEVSELIRDLSAVASVEISDGHAEAHVFVSSADLDEVAMLTACLLNAIFLRQGGRPPG